MNDKDILIKNAKLLIEHKGKCDTQDEAIVNCIECPLFTLHTKAVCPKDGGWNAWLESKERVQAAKAWLFNNTDIEQEVHDELDDYCANCGTCTCKRPGIIPDKKDKIMIDKVILERVKGLLKQVHEASYEDGLSQPTHEHGAFFAETADQSWERLGHGDLLKELEADE